MNHSDWQASQVNWRWIAGLLIGLTAFLGGLGYGLKVSLSTPLEQARVVSVQRHGRSSFRIELTVAPPSTHAGNYGATVRLFPPDGGDTVGIYVTRPAGPHSIPGVPSGAAELASWNGLWVWALAGGFVVGLVWGSTFLRSGGPQ